MIGTLTKLKDGWYVKFFEDGTVIHTYLPLHPEDENLSYAVRDSAWEGKKVNFEIVVQEETSEHYAKLIPSKEQQKQLITEIMEEDAKDGLYEDDVEKLADEEFDNIDNPTRSGIDKWSYKIGFIESYKKAKETLYTEEQVREAIEMARSRKGYVSYEYTENEIIQSFKQSKQ
jgi:hypothetical protein